MYAAAFGLHTEPFKMTPDPACVYLSNSHREALAGLTYALLGQKGFVMLTGTAGIGKTTLIARCLQHVPAGKVRSSVVVTPTVAPDEFLELVLLNFGIENVPASKAARLYQFREFLLRAERAQQIPVLVVDEAHKLNGHVLEEIRLLGNFETPEKKLLHIILAGQSELVTRVNHPDLWQLKQRLAVRLHIQPLLPHERAEYVRFRWQKAGGGAAPFEPDALETVGHVSEGIPRVINVICDNALIVAVAERRRAVTNAHVLSACADLGLSLKPGRPEPAPVAVIRQTPRPAKAAAARSALVTASETAGDTVAAPVPFRTLQRYESAPRKSLWRRWAHRLGLV
jgi:general secretion pathway protein A